MAVMERVHLAALRLKPAFRLHVFLIHIFGKCLRTYYWGMVCGSQDLVSFRQTFKVTSHLSWAPLALFEKLSECFFLAVVPESCPTPAAVPFYLKLSKPEVMTENFCEMLSSISTLFYQTSVRGAVIPHNIPDKQ